MDAIQQLGKALYNQQRFMILQAKLSLELRDQFSDSYVYAWQKNVYPILDENQTHEDLEVYFTVSREQVNLIAEKADADWRGQTLHTFYEYEDYFDSRGFPKHGIDRITLIHVFRYLYLDERFDQAFWDRLISPMNYPIEAEGITKDFNVDDEIYLQ